MNARYCINLVGVTDRSGNALEGTGTRIDITSLPGDATADRRVNNTDVGAAGTLLGTEPIDRDQLFHLRSDVNCDGRVDEADIQAILEARGNDARFVPNPCLVKVKTDNNRSILGGGRSNTSNTIEFPVPRPSRRIVGRPGRPIRRRPDVVPGLDADDYRTVGAGRELVSHPRHSSRCCFCFRFVVLIRSRFS